MRFYSIHLSIKCFVASKIISTIDVYWTIENYSPINWIVVFEILINT